MIQDRFFFELEHETIPRKSKDELNEKKINDIYEFVKQMQEQKKKQDDSKDEKKDSYVYKFVDEQQNEQKEPLNLEPILSGKTSKAPLKLHLFRNDDPVIKALNKELMNVFHVRETLKKMLKMELIKSVYVARDDLMEIIAYRNFREKVQKLSQIKKKIWDLTNEILSLMWKVEEFESKLRIDIGTNLKPMFFKEDLIKFKMQLNDFYFYKMIPIDKNMNFYNDFMKDKYKISIEKLNKISLSQINDSTEHDAQSENEVKGPSPSDLKKELNAEILRQLVGKKEDISTHVASLALENELNSQLKLQRKYRKNSKKLDNLLALVVASTEVDSDRHFNCLNKGQLIYSVFMMNRTGIIGNLREFLDQLLSSLSLQKSIELMVYTYGLFANKTFMKQINSNFQFKISEDNDDQVINEEVRSQMMKRFKRNISFLFNVSNEMLAFSQISFENHMFSQRIGEILVRNINEKVFSKILDYTNYRNYKFVNELKWFQLVTTSDSDELEVHEKKMNPNLYNLVSKLIRDWCGIADFLMNVPFMVRSVGQMFGYIENFLVEQLTIKFHVSNYHMRNFSFELEKCKEKYYRLFQVELNFEDYIEDRLSEKDIEDIGIELSHESED